MKKASRNGGSTSKQHTITQDTAEKSGHILLNSDTIDFDGIPLKNDVMFSSVFRDPENCRELLQRILGMEISELTILIFWII